MTMPLVSFNQRVIRVIFADVLPQDRKARPLLLQAAREDF